MERKTHLQTWISLETKERFSQVAKMQGLSESALLRRLVETAVLADRTADSLLVCPPDRQSLGNRISVRLRSDDLQLLRERSRARALPTSTYVSYLVRSHLRAQTPLPTAELDALKRSVAELGA